MGNIKYYVKDCLLFKGNSEQKMLGVLGWLSIAAILLNIFSMF